MQVLVNYWELKPARLASKLDQLMQQDIAHVATFIPWQTAESDISHGLTKFLQAIADRGMTASLIVSPEVGVHAPYAGIPKDLARNPEHLARNRDEHPAAVALPPRIFALPSLHSKEFVAKYQAYLAKLDGFIGEMGRTRPELFRSLQIVCTGSFWKYYRPASGSQLAPFRGQNGDRSNSAELAFRNEVEQLTLLREFRSKQMNPKAKENEALFRAHFNQNAEEVFRIRQSQLVRKKAVGVDVVQAELFTPEADPSLTYSNLFQLATRGMADFPALDRMVAEASTRQSMVGEARALPIAHWTGFGPFTRLTDSEKQFLLLKSLLLLGGRGGGVIIDEIEWHSLSKAFRARAELFARALLRKDLELETKAFCLTPHLWSEGRVAKENSYSFWPELRLALDTQARLVASAEAIAWEEEAKVVFVEPSVVLSIDRWKKLVDWTEAGRVLVLGLGQPMSDGVRADLEAGTKAQHRIDMNLGTRYHVYSAGSGKIVLYEPAASLSDWKRFVASMLSLAQASPEMGVNDPRVDLVCLKRGLESGAGRAGLFVFNGSRSPVATEIRFENEVTISDLSAVITGAPPPPRAAEPDPEHELAAESNRFELETPPCGVLPLAVIGLGEEGRERRAAGTLSGLTTQSADEAASSELSGFNMNDDFSSFLR